MSLFVGLAHMFIWNSSHNYCSASNLQYAKDKLQNRVYSAHLHSLFLCLPIFNHPIPNLNDFLSKKVSLHISPGDTQHCVISRGYTTQHILPWPDHWMLSFYCLKLSYFLQISWNLSQRDWLFINLSSQSPVGVVRILLFEYRL